MYVRPDDKYFKIHTRGSSGRNNPPGKKEGEKGEKEGRKKKTKSERGKNFERYSRSRWQDCIIRSITCSARVTRYRISINRSMAGPLSGTAAKAINKRA